MFTAASDEGVDTTDPAELEAWMARFNDRPEAERHRLLPDSAFSGPPARRSLPPVAVPSEDDVATSKESAPVLAMFRDLAAYVGTGRKLTQKGHLTLADARALVELLGTGDLMDEQIGDRTFRNDQLRRAVPAPAGVRLGQEGGCRAGGPRQGCRHEARNGACW